MEKVLSHEICIYYEVQDWVSITKSLNNLINCITCIYS